MICIYYVLIDIVEMMLFHCIALCDGLSYHVWYAQYLGLYLMYAMYVLKSSMILYGFWLYALYLRLLFVDTFDSGETGHLPEASQRTTNEQDTV